MYMSFLLLTILCWICAKSYKSFAKAEGIENIYIINFPCLSNRTWKEDTTFCSHYANLDTKQLCFIEQTSRAEKFNSIWYVIIYVHFVFKGIQPVIFSEAFISLKPSESHSLSPDWPINLLKPLPCIDDVQATEV